MPRPYLLTDQVVHLDGWPACITLRYLLWAVIEWMSFFTPILPRHADLSRTTAPARDRDQTKQIITAHFVFDPSEAATRLGATTEAFPQRSERGFERIVLRDLRVVRRVRPV